MPPAARLTDLHLCPMVTPALPPVPHVGGPINGPGAPVVLIGNLPAAVVGDLCTCVGPPDTIVKGSTAVLIDNKPAARMGDPTAHGGRIVAGCPMVLIGDGGGGGGGGGGGAAEGAGGPPAAVVQAHASNQAAQVGAVAPSQVGPLRPKQAQKEKTWIGIVLQDFGGNPMPNHDFQVTLDSGQVLKGKTDAEGRARFEDLEPDAGDVAFKQLTEIKDQGGSEEGARDGAGGGAQAADYDRLPLPKPSAAPSAPNAEEPLEDSDSFSADEEEEEA